VTPGGPRPTTNRMPPGWDVDLSDEYEWIPLRLPPDVTRVTASTRLSIEAEYRGWELTKVRLYTDGTRRVLLRRKKSRVPNPHADGLPEL
jgi:Family of unknown function (DUF5703)